MRIPAAIAKAEPLWRRIVMALAIALLLGCAARAVIRPYDGDFKVHWETGRRFLAGEFLYARGHDFPYPPILGMTFAPAALLPMPVAKAVFYPMGVAALLFLLWALRRLVRSAFRLDETHAFWAAALSVFFAGRFILRDQAELGFNTAITALTWLGIYLWRQRRDLLAGVSLGLAIAIKCTPAIFLGYFVWKRQWRMAMCTAAGTFFFTLAPVVWQGPASWSNHMRTWVVNATHGISGSGSGFGANEIFFRVTNVSLRPALMSYLTHLPKNPVRAYEPPPLDYLDLSPPVASWIVNSILFALFSIFIWWSRGIVTSRDEPRALWELAATGVLMLLLSPITWGQHCVALLPACYLVGGLLVVRNGVPGWMVTLLSIYMVFGSVMGRDLLGRELSDLLVRHHITTFWIVGLFAILLAGPRLQPVLYSKVCSPRAQARATSTRLSGLRKPNESNRGFTISPTSWTFCFGCARYLFTKFW
jgi:alpha-1,2-mannosyltransferase